MGEKVFDSDQILAENWRNPDHNIVYYFWIQNILWTIQKEKKKKTYNDILTKNDFGRVLTHVMNLSLIHSYLWISKRVRRSKFISRKCNASRHSHQFRSSVNESAWWKTYPHSCLLLYHLCRLQISNNELTHAI